MKQPPKKRHALVSGPRGRPRINLVFLALAACGPELDESVGPTDSSGRGIARQAPVHHGPDGALVYAQNARGDRIPDFSHAGYGGGGVPLPAVPVVSRVRARPGDARARIQAAIDAVSARPLAERGAILLEQGTHALSGTLVIRASGVVLRGEGSESNGTTLLSTARRKLTLVRFVGEPAAGGRTRYRLEDERRGVLDAYVPVGADRLELDDVTGLAPGQTILVHRPSTERWIHDLGMDRIPERPGRETIQWRAGAFDVDFDRVIVGVVGRQVILDAPLTLALDARYGGGWVSRYTNPSRIEQVGIEDLRGDSVFAGPEDERHAWTFVDFENVQNAWARNLVAEHFGYSAVRLADATKWVTVSHVRSLNPVSKVEPNRRYAFNIDGAQLTLFHAVSSSEGRHDFVLGARVPGPNVFLESSADSLSENGPHHRWSTGALFDNVVVRGDRASLSAYDRGNLGSGHGWSGANMVFWNARAPKMRCESPPTAENWSVGAVTDVAEGNCAWSSLGTPVAPASLYRAQLVERLGEGALDALE